MVCTRTDNAIGQRVNRLSRRERAGVSVPVAKHDIAVEFAQHVDPLAVRVKVEVAWPGPLRENQVRVTGLITHELSLSVGRKAVDPDTARAEVRDQGPLLGQVDPHLMRVASLLPIGERRVQRDFVLEHVGRCTGGPVVSDGQDREQ
jgi:hypothetical protein